MTGKSGFIKGNISIGQWNCNVRLLKVLKKTKKNLEMLIKMTPKEVKNKAKMEKDL